VSYPGDLLLRCGEARLDARQRDDCDRRVDRLTIITAAVERW
jgi:hypothetical protein